MADDKYNLSWTPSEIDTLFQNSIDHAASVDNPHAVTLAQVGGSNPNILHNINFSVNQRGVSGTVTLSAGAYGHDRWKAGASGCTYTFASSGGITTVTISAGSLMQVVEGINLQTGTHCLSWGGTATGKIGSGSYGASGVTGAVIGRSNLNVEFTAGTLYLPKLEFGSSSTFSGKLFSDYGEELRKCQRYCMMYGIYAQWCSTDVQSNYIDFTIQVPSNMRETPALENSANFSILGQSGFVFAAVAMSGNNIRMRATKAGHGLSSAILECTGLAGFSADL